MSRLDYVRVATSRGVHTISWATRDELVKRVRLLGEDGADVARAFEAVGATRPVELREPEGVNALIAAIEEWARDLGAERMPEDAAELREMLYAHLHDRGFHD